MPATLATPATAAMIGRPATLGTPGMAAIVRSTVIVATRGRPDTLATEAAPPIRASVTAHMIAVIAT